jgi:hypothetical protein
MTSPGQMAGSDFQIQTESPKALTPRRQASYSLRLCASAQRPVRVAFKPLFVCGLHGKTLLIPNLAKPGAGGYNFSIPPKEILDV